SRSFLQEVLLEAKFAVLARLYEATCIPHHLVSQNPSEVPGQGVSLVRTRMPSVSRPPYVTTLKPPIQRSPLLVKDGAGQRCKMASQLPNGTDCSLVIV